MWLVKNSLALQSHQILQTFVWWGPHHTNVCKILLLCGAMSLLAFITWKGLLENCEKRKPKVVFVANERWLFTRVFNCSMYFGWWENFGDLDGVVIVMRDGCKKESFCSSLCNCLHSNTRYEKNLKRLILKSSLGYYRDFSTYRYVYIILFFVLQKSTYVP